MKGPLMKTVKVSTKPLSITPGEKECLILSGCGLSENAFSKVLKISLHTVRIHIQISKNRLGANNKTHAVIRALIKLYISLKEIQDAQVRYIK